MRKPKNTRMRKPTSTPSVVQEVPGTREQVESLHARLAAKDETLAFQADTVSILRDQRNQYRDIAVGSTRDAVVATNVATHLNRVRDTLVESFLQERSDLLARILRIDQRLQAAGFDPGQSAFELVGKDLNVGA